MPSFGIYTNLQKDPDLSIAKTIVEQLKKRGCPCFLEQEVAQMLGMPAISQGCMDILLVLGGDGTMLAAARKYAQTALIWGAWAF